MDFIIWFVGNFFTIIAIGGLLILIISLFYDGLPLPNQKNEVIYNDQNDKEDDEENEVITENDEDHDFIDYRFTDDLDEIEDARMAYSKNHNRELEDDDFPFEFILLLAQEYKKTKEEYSGSMKAYLSEIKSADYPSLYKWSFIKYDDLLNDFIDQYIGNNYDDKLWENQAKVVEHKNRLRDSYYEKYKVKYENEVVSLNFGKLPDDEIKKLEKLRRNKSNDKDENLKK
jgi:hypothetical protein